MKQFAFLVCFWIIAAALYAQAPRKYELPEPEQPKQEATKANSWGSLLSTAARVATSTMGLIQQSVNLQEVSNSLYTFENNVGGSWMKDARDMLGKTKDALQLYMVNEEGAYLYDPSTRTLNLVAEGDFRDQIIEQHKKYEGARILIFAGQTLETFAKGQLEQGADKLLGGEKKAENSGENTTDETSTGESYPTTFSPGKVFVLLGAKKYTFD